MNTDPDLPRVPSFRKVTSLSEVKPVNGFGDGSGDHRKRHRATEMDFRKQLQDAIHVLQEREACDLGFEMVELDGELAVSVVDGAGESIGLMQADDAISRADTGNETAFFVDREC